MARDEVPVDTIPNIPLVHELLGHLPEEGNESARLPEVQMEVIHDEGEHAPRGVVGRPGGGRMIPSSFSAPALLRSST